MDVGEGSIPPRDPRESVEDSGSDTLPNVPTVARGIRIHITYFRAITTIEEVELYIDENRQRISDFAGGVQVSLPLFEEWISPPLGRIPVLSHSPQESKLSHSIVIKDYDRTRREFRFWNRWQDWGDKSFGYLPYDYFEKYAFECDLPYVQTYFLRDKKEIIGGLGTVRTWTARTTGDLRMYGFEFFAENPADRDRIAWCFLIVRDGTLEIQEFYVRPEFRRRGYGRALAANVGSFIRRQGKPVTLCVPFADSRSESPGTYEGMVAISQRLGLVFYKSDSHFAAYLAGFPRPDADASPQPIEPDFIPVRAKSTHFQLIATFALTAASAYDGINLKPTAVVEHAFPEVGTEAWDEMNRKRNSFIRREVSQGLDSLSDYERREYQWLQEMSLRAVQKKQPKSQLSQDLEELQEALRQDRGTNPA